MRRADRLFDLIQMLRDGRLHRATELATRLEVSVRTVWRDMATLMQSGLPVEGERGVGYILRAPLALPPMMLTAAELDALRAGLVMVAAGDQATLARAARSLAAKIAAVTPAPRPTSTDDSTADLFALQPRRKSKPKPHLPQLRAAIRSKERLTLSYTEANGQENHMDIRPLQVDLTSRIWTLACWCEQRQDFRTLRIDRIQAITRTGERFAAEPGKTLADYREIITP